MKKNLIPTLIASAALLAGTVAMAQQPASGAGMPDAAPAAAPAAPMTPPPAAPAADQRVVIPSAPDADSEASEKTMRKGHAGKKHAAKKHKAKKHAKAKAPAKAKAGGDMAQPEPAMQ